MWLLREKLIMCSERRCHRLCLKPSSLITWLLSFRLNRKVRKRLRQLLLLMPRIQRSLLLVKLLHGIPWVLLLLLLKDLRRLAMMLSCALCRRRVLLQSSTPWIVLNSVREHSTSSVLEILALADGVGVMTLLNFVIVTLKRLKWGVARIIQLAWEQISVVLWITIIAILLLWTLLTLHNLRWIVKLRLLLQLNRISLLHHWVMTLARRNICRLRLERRSNSIVLLLLKVSLGRSSPFLSSTHPRSN